MLIQVKDHSNLYRDEATGAILNTSGVELAKYMSARKLKEEQQRELAILKDEVLELKAAVKALLNATQS